MVKTDFAPIYRNEPLVTIKVNNIKKTKMIIYSREFGKLQKLKIHNKGNHPFRQG